jgi:hypothetical protein
VEQWKKTLETEHCSRAPVERGKAQRGPTEEATQEDDVTRSIRRWYGRAVTSGR